MKYPDVLIPEEQLLGILEDLNINIVGQTSTDIICSCPFHLNLDTPAFNISKNKNHLFRCWNPSCGAKGNIFILIERIKGVTPIASLGYLHSFKTTTRLASRNQRKKEERDYETIEEEALENFSYSLWDLGYMLRRGFNKSTIRYFQVGRIGNYITIPVWDENNRLVGISKRDVSPAPKRKYLDSGLPKKYVLFNLNNAIRHDSVIVVEGPMDAMRVHQAGYHNVVAILSGSLSKFQESLLKRNFRECIIFTDNDDAGRRLGEDIANRCRQLRIYWAEYPSGAKDPGELSEEAIQKAIKDKKSNLMRKITKVLGGI